MPTAPFHRRFRKRIKRLGEEAAICSRLAGVAGLIALLGRVTVSYPRQISVMLDGLRHPFSLRLGTSDAKVCEEVLLGRDYLFAVNFSPRTIVDVGANCGMTSIFYANQFPEARVWAIEPEASNYEALVRNTREYPNVTPIRAALWREDGEVELFAPWPKWTNWGKWGFTVRPGHGCRAITVPTLMREIGTEVIDILKVDIEGAEREVFSGADWIDRVKLLAIELHDRTHPGCTAILDAVAGSRTKTQKEFVTFYH